MSLRVQRLRNTLVAPRDLPRRDEISTRLEASLGRSGVELLGRLLDEVLDHADPSVWVIRRLRLAFAIREPRDAETMWARGVREGLRRQIQYGADGRNVLRFPDRATYWAWYLRDRVIGGPLHWWHQSLAPLQHLDFGAACVTLLSRKRELTVSVLGLLEEWGAWRVAAAQLSEYQAEQLLGWISDARELPANDVLDTAIDTWNECAAFAKTPAAVRLSVVLRLLRRVPSAAPAVLRAAVEIVAEAVDTLRRLSSVELAKLATAEWSGAAVETAANHAAPAALRTLLRLASREKIEQLVRGLEGAEGRENSNLSTTIATQFGGWFLLLPSYLALDVDFLAEQTCRPALRWLLARMCMGPRGRAADPNDPALLWASGLEKPPAAGALPWPDTAQVESWLGEIGLAEESDQEYFGDDPLESSWMPVAACVVRHFARQLQGFAHSSPAHLDANLFAGRASLHAVPGSAEIVLSQRPLDILLQMGGFDGRSYAIPWNDYVSVTIRLD